MADVDKYLAEQQARNLTDQVLKSLRPNVPKPNPSRPVCLVSSFARRSDLPEIVSLIKMSPEVQQNLKSIGLNEPISIQLLQDKWWFADVDASADNPHIESGSCTVTVIGTTEQLTSRYWSVYCEFKQGPYSSRDEIDGLCLVTDGFDRSKLGPTATTIVIPGFSARWLEQQGLHEPFPISALQDKWWICGMGGGICTTMDLPAMVTIGWHVTDGPFASKSQAEYQFDCLWESPE